MNNLIISRPEKSEYASYYYMYVTLVEGDIISALKQQIDKTIGVLSDINEEKGQYKYADGKWSIKELVGHLLDTERIMAYRALRIARGDKTPTAGFEQDDYIENSNFDLCSLSVLTKEFELIRQSNILMFSNLTESAWHRTGTASDNTFSTRALAYIIAGHELHHINVLQEKYLS